MYNVRLSCLCCVSLGLPPVLRSLFRLLPLRCSSQKLVLIGKPSANLASLCWCVPVLVCIPPTVWHAHVMYANLRSVRHVRTVCVHLQHAGLACLCSTSACGIQTCATGACGAHPLRLRHRGRASILCDVRHGCVGVAHGRVRTVTSILQRIVHFPGPRSVWICGKHVN